MRRKAREALEAARVLLERGLLNDAASRLYYAAFLAGIHGLERLGKRPADFRGGSTYWDHRTVAREVVRIRGLSEDGALLKRLRILRLRADYGERLVDRAELEFVIHETRRFVEQVTA
ncbi:MAG TPA: HEPN domain-containing protein [Planctomycetota bacterium]|jgi:uncharacterized protein (UPF0332 family)|nr:HEPN domain-containing protein [Planctomycetota bacterium]